MRKGLILKAVLCWLVLVLPSVTTVEGGIGDESDGSRAVPVHLIRLYDERGANITAGDDLPQPFSMRQTCGKCHACETISGGWHFNAIDPNVAPGRPGQPWILVDHATGTQMPLAYRSWPGTFRPEQIGLTPWQFMKRFGRQMPGGGVGELESDEPAEIMRQLVSGKLEVNCLSCHNAHPGQDQSDIFGYASQVARENFRWAATASCEFATVSGSAAAQLDTYDPLMSDAIAVKYRAGTFDYKNRVLFDIVRRVSDERCYFCHSNRDIQQDSEKWATDEDVHLAAGLTCVDCHRSGLEHNITRGYDGEDEVSSNPLAATSTCKGCHLEMQSSSAPAAGRLGAPRPRHAGIPPIHFDKLTCTACHSGRWPRQKTIRTKSSRAHGLGLHLVNKSDDALPHIIYPIFARQDDGRIAPHKLFWPAFWGAMKAQAVKPIKLATARQTVGKVLGMRVVRPGWLSLTEEQVTTALTALSSQPSIQGKPVYICGGKLHRLDDSGELAAQQHPAAEASLWPIAHNVRPAVQSLGVRSCQDCHATDAPFFFADVEIDSPLVADKTSAKMIDFQNLKPFYVKAFAFSFVFRPWLKLVILASCAGLAGVLVLYALRALALVFKVLSEENSQEEMEDV
ncbi:MAG: cytochrome c3 family protein [Planctomycetota bacterium]